MMVRYWTCHWKFRLWRDKVNPENRPLFAAASSNFLKRRVNIGDRVYILSLHAGQLHLGGRMTVMNIVPRAEAVRMFNDSTFYDAEEFIVDPDRSGSRLHLHRQLAPELSSQLRFVSPDSDPKGYLFDSDTHLNNETTRGVRQLTPESAALLDQIIEITDRSPNLGQLITVTEELLRNGRGEVRLPEEVTDESTYAEGSVQRILVNRYERDPRARQECISHHGTTCSLCGFDFVAVYGEVMAGFIHIHHLNQLSSVGADYRIDPVRDMRPVCPNCHAVLHHRSEPPYSLDEVRQFLQARRGSDSPRNEAPAT